MSSLFLRHLPEIYLFHGFSFLTLASVVALQPKGYETKLERHLWLLGLFGLVHGLTELLFWAMLAYPAQAQNIEPIAIISLAVSYVPLLSFGRLMLRDAGGHLGGRLGTILNFALIASAVFALVVSHGSWGLFSAFVRILLGFPSAIFASAAFLALAQAAKRDYKNSVCGSPHATTASVVFLIYGILTLIVDKPGSDLLPWLPTRETFLEWTGIPVQLCRALCAIAAAGSVSFFLRNLNNAVRANEVKLTQELNTLNATLEHRVQTRTRDLHTANRELENQIERQREVTNDLARSESQLRSVFDQAAVGITFLDINGHYLRVNERFAQILGRPKGEIVGHHFRDFTHEDDIPEDLRRWPSRNNNQRGFFTREKRYRRPDGSTLWCSTTISQVGGADGEILHFLGVVVDISERKVAETAHQESEQLLRLALAAARHGLFSFEVEKRFVTVISAPNDKDSGADYHGDYEGWIKRIHPEDHGRAIQLRQMIEKSEPDHHITFEFRRKRLDGTYSWVLATGSCVKNAGHGGTRFVGTHVDITEQREFERRILRTQRLESIGQLASGIAHDLNNAIVPILSGLSLIKAHIPKEDAEIFAAMEVSAKHTADMGRQLLSFARGADGRRLHLRPSDIINEVSRLISTTFPKNIRVKNVCASKSSSIYSRESEACLGQCPECASQAASILGDPTQLHQVLLNLCINARDAMPNGGELLIQLARVRISPEEAALQNAAAPGLYACLTVADTGTGIPTAVLDRIFDPFFTTKGPEKGTGLGLATVLGIVKGHGGFITVSTRENEGTQFHVHLPIVDASSGTGTPLANQLPGT